MYRAINADYYGFRDEEDGVLERVEAGAEAEMRAQVRAGPTGWGVETGKAAGGGRRRRGGGTRDADASAVAVGARRVVWGGVEGKVRKGAREGRRGGGALWGAVRWARPAASSAQRHLSALGAALLLRPSAAGASNSVQPH